MNRPRGALDGRRREGEWTIDRLSADTSATSPDGHRADEVTEDGTRPRVAFETAVVTAGVPLDRRDETVRRMTEAIRVRGADPAWIGLLSGEIRIGLTEAELARLAESGSKVSTRDLPLAMASRASGGTTVASTVFLAHRAGIRVVATGGIGGVHPGPGPPDESADLLELSRTPIVLVCSGAKAILDLPATAERLETLGATVVGYGTDELPAFWSAESGVGLDATVDSAHEVAAIHRAALELGTPGAVVVCVPPPQGAALDREESERAIRRALEAAREGDVTGPDLTPFLLDRIVDLTEGRSLEANLALLEGNAAVAAEIALELARCNP